MAARNFYVPGNHVFNSNGLAVPGATATLYTSGTSTLAAFYSDIGLTVSLGATITANGAGHFSDAYGSDALPYRLVLKDKAGTTLDDIDPFYFGQTYITVNSTSVTPQMYGAVADGVINDYAAFAAAIAAANLLAQDTYGTGIPSLYVPSGTYFLGTGTLDLTRPTAIIGENVRSTVLTWTNGTTCIRTQHLNTTGATGVQASTGYTGLARIANITIDGGYTSGAESNAYGIHARTSTDIDDVVVRNCAGDGIYLRADTADGAVLGNANMGSVRNVLTYNCRKGLYAYGLDVNANSFDNIRSFGNRQWAIHDNSFLGNTYDAPVAESTARTTLNDGVTVACSYVSSAGNWYFCIPGQEVGASTNAPSGTTANNTWWGYWKAGAPATGVPAWVSGLVVRAGGAYFIEGLTNQTQLYNCYQEDDEISLVGQCGLMGGKIAGAYVWRCVSGTLGGKIGDANGPNAIFTSSAGTEFAGYTRFTGDPTFASGNTYIGPVVGTSQSTWLTSSNGGSIDGLLYSGSVNAGLRLYGRGGMLLGTLSGTSGTDIVSIDSTAGVRVYAGSFGYGAGTGVGGAVTQITSRTTGVTLNKACGAITLVSAAGSASWQSFTVTNSLVAATDVIRVVQKSGTDLNMIHVTNVAAGSFKISFATTGGTTVEQPVFNFAVVNAAVT